MSGHSMRLSIILCAALLALGSAVLLGSPRSARAAGPVWLSIMAKARLARLTLVAGWQGNNGGLNFNGYANGRMIVTVPLGWKVQVTFSNQNPAPHSAEFIAYRLPVPEGGFTPTFKNASSPDPVEGIEQGHRPQTVTFVATKIGRYMIVCGVPGHANGGMWDTFVVSKTARTAALTSVKG